MTQHTCQQCQGDNYVCAKCKRSHKRNSFRKCRGRSRVVCPGDATTDKPHFETSTECDVCRVRKKGPMYVGVGLDSGGWEYLFGRNIMLCPDCKKRHAIIQEMALEKLKEERGELRQGEWLEPRDPEKR